MRSVRRLRTPLRRALLLLVVLLTVMTVAFSADTVLAAATTPTGEANTSINSPVRLEVPIGNTDQVRSLQEYVAVAYQFLVSIVGILATVKIMVGGISWATAGGSAQGISDAKEHIYSALIGLGIALLSYIILNILNPLLVDGSFSGVPDLSDPITEAAGTVQLTESPECNSTYPASPKGQLYDLRLSMPDELSQYWSSGQNPACSEGAVIQQFAQAVKKLADPASPYAGMKLIVSSTARTETRQQFHYDCYQERLSTGVCSAACTSGGSSCNLASNPAGRSTHIHANALDLSWSPSSGGAYVSLNGKGNKSWHNSCAVNGSCSQAEKDSLEAFANLLNDSGMRHICKEWWHYELPGGRYQCDRHQYNIQQ